MNGWNRQFNAYRVKSNGLPWWVTRLPMVVLVLLLVPAALAAIAAVLAGALVFVVLLVFWRVISNFFPSAGVAGSAPEPDEGRVNVKVVGRDA